MPNPNGAELETGLKAVGRVPWGSHFCIFYETKKDLLDIVVPYFKTGLANNEFCLWILAPYQFVSVEEARKALAKAWPELARFLREGKIEIVRHDKWFGINGSFDSSKVIRRFRKKLAEGERRGFSGLRVNGSSGWLRVEAGRNGHCRYEQEVDSMLANQRMIVACTFPLILTGANQILDAVRTHQFAVTVRHGVWKRVEIADMERARKEATRVDRRLEDLTYRQRQVLQFVAEGRNTKEIAALLGISVKTVEAHRLQLMRRLKIHNVPGLVRFAIRTGLVSAET